MSLEELTRPIIGLENRTPQEVFDIMKDRIIQQAESVERSHIQVIFDGPPSAESGRFVEVTNDDGEGINAGDWIDLGEGYWSLRIALNHDASELVEALKRARIELAQYVGEDSRAAKDIDSALANWESRTC